MSPQDKYPKPQEANPEQGLLFQAVGQEAAIGAGVLVPQDGVFFRPANISPETQKQITELNEQSTLADYQEQTLKMFAAESSNIGFVKKNTNALAEKMKRGEPERITRVNTNNIGEYTAIIASRKLEAKLLFGKSLQIPATIETVDKPINDNAGPRGRNHTKTMKVVRTLDPTQQAELDKKYAEYRKDFATPDKARQRMREQLRVEREQVARQQQIQLLRETR